MPKQPIEPLSEDQLRVKVLAYFYNAYKSPRGMSSYKIPIGDATSDLKNQGIERKDALRAMIYLLETQWLKKETEESQFYTGKQTVTNKKDFYKISSDGIDYFEGLSQFRRENKLAGVNITNLQGVVSIGDNNFIQNEFSDLFRLLDCMGKQLRISQELDDQEKINYQADIETIKAQLVKPKPDKEIVGKAWNALKGIATIGGVVGFYEKIVPIIQHLVH